jgi:histidinol-phosphate aminotransferase
MTPPKAGTAGDTCPRAADPALVPQPGIMDIAPYVGGESTLPGVDRVLKLSSNENPYGPGPAASAAFAAAAATLHLYPSSSHLGLRTAIAEVEGLEADRIICGAGSDEVISFLCQTFAGPGTEVLYTRHGFSLYRITALAAGATPVVAEERDRRVAVDKVLAAVTDRTRLVFITNPGNPTGTILAADDLVRLADALPAHCLLVLDGAYAEFGTAPGFDGGKALARRAGNVMLLRTFSKIHGLGGLRIGWGYGPAPVIDALNRVRGPFNLSTPALMAAEAAIRDRDWVARCRDLNARWRGWLAAELAAIGLPSDPSEANFILVRFGDESEAGAADAALRADGILVRKVKGYGFPEALRITIGDEAGCRRVAAVLARFMAGRR